MSNVTLRRVIVSLSLTFIVLAGLLLVARGETANAQDAMASHPIVGTWRFVRDFGEGPTITYGIFHADGTYFQEGYAGGPLNFGAWEPTGDHTVDLRYHQLYYWEERLVEAEARYAFTVDETGDTLDGQGVYVSRYVDDGSLEYTFETTTPGTRITAEPLVSLETLIAETEPQATPIP
jgi:hypothetical protein